MEFVNWMSYPSKIEKMKKAFVLVELVIVNLLLQDGNKCFCGHTFGKYGTKKGCTIKCEGNDQEWCGGFSTNFVYNIYGKF